MKRDARAGEPASAVAPGTEVVVPAGEFKARCLAILDQVAITGQAITVTKRGRPVARVVPIEEASAPSMFGSVRLLSPKLEDYYGTDEVWDAEQGRL